MSAFLLVWYATGWAGVAWFCKYRWNCLSLCQAFACMLFLPIPILGCCFMVFVVVWTVATDWMSALGHALIVTSAVGALLLMLYLALVIADRFSGRCPIVWRKE